MPTTNCGCWWKIWTPTMTCCCIRSPVSKGSQGYTPVLCCARCWNAASPAENGCCSGGLSPAMLAASMGGIRQESGDANHPDTLGRSEEHTSELQSRPHLV